MAFFTPTIRFDIRVRCHYYRYTFFRQMPLISAIRLMPLYLRLRQSLSCRRCRAVITRWRFDAAAISRYDIIIVTILLIYIERRH